MKRIGLFLQLLAVSLGVQAQNAPLATVAIQEPSLVCSQGGCTQLTADYSVLKSTSEYVINSIPFNPLFPFTGGTIIPPTGDDYWGTEVSLPFSFSFFDHCYNSLLVGTNGVITFDLTNNAPLGFCQWNFTQTIPNANFSIRNAIYGVYQDSNIQSPPVTNPAVQNVNYYVLETGVNAAPNRVFVINFNQLPQYQCATSVGLQTSQIVIHETTNIIDIYVKNRVPCTNWNGGLGLIGIQNQEGTIAYTPLGRNSGTWSASNEAWRILPNGSALSTVFSWYDNEVLISGAFTNTLLVCPTDADHYKVKMAVTVCDNTPTIIESNTVSQLVAPDPGILSPTDLFFCTQSPFVYVANLESNTAYMLSGVPNPVDYEVTYYENMSDAENGTPNNIVTINNYSFTENKTIYAAIQENAQTGCRYVKPFQLLIIPPVNPPTGSSLQNFTAGQTLADLIVTGDNIVWYDSATGGNLLLSSTVLQDNVTYYAAQSNSGCESRNVNTTRLAVTVHLVLSNVDFSSESIAVFPNPAHESIGISCHEVIKSMQIANALGQEIITVNPNEKESTILISGFPNGLYCLRIQTSNGMKTIKIVKE